MKKLRNISINYNYTEFYCLLAEYYSGCGSVTTSVYSISAMRTDVIRCGFCVLRLFRVQIHAQTSK